MNVYPSIAVLLAEEQLAGRLRISLERMSTSSELRTPEMTARIEEAFGVRPFDLYGTTEGLWGAECDRRTGIHLFEDTTLVENVDDDCRPVPYGEPGLRPLVTSLVQPRPAADPPRARRRGDPRPGALRLRAHADAGSGRSTGAATTCSSCPPPVTRSVAVHPLQFSVVARDSEVVEFQVVQEGTRLRVLVVPRGEGPALETRLRTAVEHRLRDVGVAEPAIEVERVPALARQPGGKLQIVVADRDARQPVAL